MSEERVFFSHANQSIKKLFKEEGIPLTPKSIKELLPFLSKIHMYEEEERKIKPEVIIGCGLTSMEFRKYALCDTILIDKSTVAKNDFNQKLKPLMPFCENGWRVFISFENGFIKYGIMRSFNGPSALMLTDTLFSNVQEEGPQGLNFVLIDVESKHEIVLLGAHGHKLNIDFRFSQKVFDDKKKIIDDIVNDFTLDCEKMQIEKIRVALKKLFLLCQKRLHGTICLIIKADCVLPIVGFLNDGVFLDEPIALVDILNDTIITPDEIYSLEKYYALSGVLIEMMNMDGITIIDTKGRIRAYNVFISPEKTDRQVTGGARKRAAHFLKQSKNSNIIGVYMQSQDGDINYERVVKNAE